MATRKLPSILALLALVFVVAACAACLSVFVYSKVRGDEHADAHEWVHKQLGLTPEQEKALAPIEARYEAERRELERKMHLGNIELAKAILAEKRDSERVRAAIEQIHRDMGDLQKLTIAHVFEMRDVLDPDQYDKLLNLTAEALYHIDSEHAER